MGQGPRYPSYETPHEETYPSYDDQFAEPVDLDAFGSQLRSNRPARSIATREEFLPDDSVPLFLSGSDDELHSPKFGRPRKKSSSRLLKTAAFAVAVTVATFVAVKNPFTVFANATASLMGAQDSRLAPAAAAPPPRQADAAPSPRLADARATSVAVVAAATPAAAVPIQAVPTQAVPAQAVPTQAVPVQAPSRDDIAVALKTAHQNLAPPEVPPPPAAAPVQLAAVAPAAAVAPVVAAPVAVAAPSVVAAPPIRRLDADELATLMTRGKALLDSGDISPARLLLERAAEAGEVTAALMLAQTYDPGVLGTSDIRNITSDPAIARKWYQRAAQLGSADAQRRLSQLQ
jgi:hypothetical protein